ncbi:hypothetical protein D3C80_2166800 [compost metagenome]
MAHLREGFRWIGHMLQDVPTDDQVIGAVAHIAHGDTPSARHGGLVTYIENIDRIAVTFEWRIGPVPSSPI